MKNIEDKIFLIVIVLVLSGGFFKPLVKPMSINYLENRTANVLPKLSLKSILNKSYQDNFELALADQIPLAGRMKLSEKIFSFYTKVFFSNIVEQQSINLGEVSLYRGYLIYDYVYLDDIKSNLNERLNNINTYIDENDDTEFYVFYIEKDTDINFNTNEKTGVYEYISEGLDSTVKSDKFAINSFDDFKNYFYKTDHHWNYKGSYKAYLQLAELFEIEDVIKPENEICLNAKMSGSKSSSIGMQTIFKEEFCAYKFNFREHDIYENESVVSNYGGYEDYFNDNTLDTVSYGMFYGWDIGLLEFDYHNEEKENLLIIGESYDNAISELLASHFNKTYNIDLRHYEDSLDKKLDLKNFIKENKIDKVLLIGNIAYYSLSTYDLS